MLDNYKHIIQNHPCDVLILDPPRAGIHPKTLREIIKEIVPKGFFLPVVPGTSNITVGGADRCRLVRTRGR